MIGPEDGSPPVDAWEEAARELHRIMWAPILSTGMKPVPFDFQRHVCTLNPCRSGGAPRRRHHEHRLRISDR